MTDALVREVRQLLRQASEAAATAEARDALTRAAARLDGPLRVALVGRVKAGKSTLVNALVGEQVAETDVAEATRVVTWYRYGPVPGAVVHPVTGLPEQRPFSRTTGAFSVDLGRPADEVARVEITVPNDRLRGVTLVDTPGLASLSTAGDRTVSFLESQADRPSEADAAVYLLRHVHADDVRFLEAFQPDDLVHGTPLNTVGVLGRADEVGLCRLDAMDVAQRVADRYSEDPRLRRLCPVVVPVSGLLATAGTTWREDEFRALARIATAPRDEVVELLLSAGAWATASTTVQVIPIERRHLLDRLGLFGVRLGVHLIRSGRVRDGASLGRELTAWSGIDRLRALLSTQFLARASAIKARSAVAVLDAVLKEGGCHRRDRLALELDELRSSAHEFVELRMLELIRSGSVKGASRDLEEVERLLGGSGNAPAARLGLPPDATTTELRAAGYAALTHCRSLAEHGLTAPLRRLASAAGRSCEGLLHDLDSVGAEVEFTALDAPSTLTQVTTEQSAGSRSRQ